MLALMALNCRARAAANKAMIVTNAASGRERPKRAEIRCEIELMFCWRAITSTVLQQAAGEAKITDRAEIDRREGPAAAARRADRAVQRPGGAIGTRAPDCDPRAQGWLAGQSRARRSPRQRPKTTPPDR